MHKIREKLMKELKTYESGEINSTSLKEIHLLTDTIKNIDKIEMAERYNHGYSYDDSYRGDSYADGESYRRGRRYSRDSYAEDDAMRHEGFSERRGYSRAESSEHVRKELEKLYREADHESTRQAIQRCMNEV